MIEIRPVPAAAPAGLGVDGWNREPCELSADSIVELFERQVERSPDAAAAVYGDAAVSFGDLNRSANRLARGLRALGVRTETIVGVCVAQGLDVPAALLAIAKAGGAYLPIDPSHPRDRIAYMLEDSGASLVLCSRMFAGAFEAAAARRIVAFEELDELEAEESDENLGIDLYPDALAYVIYTSGSTGHPKGAAIPHRGIVRLVSGAGEYLDLSADEALLQLSPLSFDASIIEIWCPLATGGRIVLDRPGRLLEGFGEIVERQGVSVVLLISPQFDLLMSREPATLGRIRQVMVGGDVVSLPRFRSFRRRFPQSRLVATYGPTESTLFASVYVASELVERTPSVPIGRPVANTRLYIVDDAVERVPIGAPGELLIGGDGLARGYHDRPALTAERFVPDPFGPAGSRLYRSGDVARYLPTGDIEFLGREDEQVKVRGYRVEVGEIEMVLLEHGDVAQVVVHPQPSGADSFLAAYVVPADGRLDVTALRAHLQERLPEYMIPSAFVALEQIPLTANNKVDRAALPPARRGGDGTVADDDLPVGETEQLVARVWARALGVDRLPATKSFFDVGGTSLVAMQVVAETSRAFGSDVPLQTIFRHPTVRGFARALDGQRAATSKDRRRSATASRRRSRHTDADPLDGTLRRADFTSGALGNRRRIDVYTPRGFDPTSATTQLLLFLDGRAFVDVMHAPATLDRLARTGAIPPTLAAFVDSIDMATRDRELLCRPAFTRFLADELVPWLETALAAPRGFAGAAIVGASAGALAAAFAAHERPDVFGRVVAISGPFMWSPSGDHSGWLIEQYKTAPRRPVEFYIAFGKAEADQDAVAAERIPAASRAFARALRAKGYSVQIAESGGGHDFASWRSILEPTLIAVLGGAPDGRPG